MITPVQGSATPYSKKLTIVGSGASETFTLGDFAIHLDEGPLKRTILGAASADLDHFNVDGVRGSEIRIYDVAAVPVDAVATKSGTRLIRWLANADPAFAGLACQLTALDTLTIEIRLNHSTQA